MEFVSLMAPKNINVSASLAQQTSHHHCAITMTSHTRTSVNTITRSAWIRKSRASNIKADANVSVVRRFDIYFLDVDKKMTLK